MVNQNARELACARYLDYPTIIIGLYLLVLGTAIMVYCLKKYRVNAPVELKGKEESPIMEETDETDSNHRKS